MLPVDALEMPQIAIPPRSLVDAFSTLATTARRRQEEMIIESKTLAALRDVPLPKLISGELRIRDAEKFAAEAASQPSEVLP